MAVSNSGGPMYGGYAPQAKVRFDAIGEAWRLFQPQMGAWIPAVLVAMVPQLILQGVQQVMFGGLGRGQSAQQPSGATLLAIPVFVLLNWVISAFFMGGLFRMALKQVRGETISFNDVLSGGDLMGNILVALILTGIAAGLGFCLCIIPCFIVGGLLMLTMPLIVDKRLGATEAMSLSWNTLKPDMMTATLFAIVLGLVAASGFLLCGVGILITYPLYFLSLAIVYRDFFLGQQSDWQAAPPPPHYPPPPIPQPPGSF